jgi:hypothetical protein
LQTEMLDERRNEALFVLQFHRIEGAAIGVDADKKLVFGINLVHLDSYR